MRIAVLGTVAMIVLAMVMFIGAPPRDVNLRVRPMNGRLVHRR